MDLSSPNPQPLKQAAGMEMANAGEITGAPFPTEKGTTFPGPLSERQGRFQKLASTV